MEKSIILFHDYNTKNKFFVLLLYFFGIYFAKIGEYGQMKKYLQMACDLGYYYASCKLVEYYGKNKNHTQMKKYYQIGINWRIWTNEKIFTNGLWFRLLLCKL